MIFNKTAHALLGLWLIVGISISACATDSNKVQAQGETIPACAPSLSEVMPEIMAIPGGAVEVTPNAQDKAALLELYEKNKGPDAPDAADVKTFRLPLKDRLLVLYMSEGGCPFSYTILKRVGEDA